VSWGGEALLCGHQEGASRGKWGRRVVRPGCLWEAWQTRRAYRAGSEVYLSFARLGAGRPSQRVQVETTRRRVGWLHPSAQWQKRCEGEPERLLTGSKHRTNGWSNLSRRKFTQALTLVHHLYTRPRGFASGYPVVVMAQPTHDRTSDHLVPCILGGWNRPALHRYLLPNALMRSCLIEVHHIGIEDALEMPLM
jgi:hypothetical protein